MEEHRSTSQHTLRLYADIKQAIVSSQLEFALLDQSADEHTILVWHNETQKIIGRVSVGDKFIRFAPEYAKGSFEAFEVSRQSTDFIARLSRTLRSGMPAYEGWANRRDHRGKTQPTLKLVNKTLC